MRNRFDEQLNNLNNELITMGALCEEAISAAVKLLIENDHVAVIDTSTAHRTNDAWAYGFAELSPAHREAIRNSKRIANPGCHASGFIAGCYPLVAHGVVPADFPLTAYSLTGYSGGGKKLIAEYVKESNCSLILVTHSLQQARRIADEVWYFHKGKLLETGSAEQVLYRPEQPETRQFLEFYGV